MSGIEMTQKIAAADITPELLVELRRWWDAFGNDNTPLAISKMANEYLAERELLYQFGKHVRNTDSMDVVAWGVAGADLLLKLRNINPERYKKQVSCTR